MVLGGASLVATAVAIVTRRARTLAPLGAAIVFLSIPEFITAKVYVPATAILLVIATGVAVKDREACGTAIADMTSLIVIAVFLASFPTYLFYSN